MIDTIKNYLELEKTVTFNKTEKEIDVICDRLSDMEISMSLSELESLRGKIPKRDFYERIMPLIDAKTGRSYRDDEAAAQSKPATPTKPFRTAAVKSPTNRHLRTHIDTKQS
jgi:hypothetical protein